MLWFLGLGIAYLIGSIPTAFLVVKQLKQVDVRSVGSGNVGATNVTRAAGFKAGLFVFLVDALKGVVAVKVVAPLLLPQEILGGLACGLAAVVGHIAPIFLGFRGGKGVATTIGVMISALPMPALACLGAWLVVFLVWRYISLASLVAMLILPPAMALSGYPPASVAIGAAVALLVVAKHHANIDRLRQGTEHRFGKSRKPA